MHLYERFAHRLIGSPLQQPAERLRLRAKQLRWLRHPELEAIWHEDIWLRQFLHHSIKDGMNCVDVGAHLGAVLQLFTELSPHGAHTAFEPVGYKAAWLRKKYPQVDILPVALSDSADAVAFYYDKRRSGYSSLRPSAVSAESTQKQTVQSRTLSDSISAEKPVHFIKIDVEGAELAVLKGADALIERNRPTLLLECTLNGLSAFGYQPSEVFEYITHHLAYRLRPLASWRNQHVTLDTEQFVQLMQYPYRAFNFIAIPK